MANHLEPRYKVLSTQSGLKRTVYIMVCKKIWAFHELILDIRALEDLNFSYSSLLNIDILLLSFKVGMRSPTFFIFLQWLFPPAALFCMGKPPSLLLSRRYFRWLKGALKIDLKNFIDHLKPKIPFRTFYKNQFVPWLA